MTATTIGQRTIIEDKNATSIIPYIFYNKTNLQLTYGVLGFWGFGVLGFS